MTEMTRQEAPIEALDILVGEWITTASLAADPADAPRESTSIDWLAGERFLIQRREVDHPDAPDGIVSVGSDDAGAA